MSITPEASPCPRRRCRLISIVRCLFKGHVFIHDGFVPSAEGLIVRRRCLRCRRLRFEPQQVRRRLM